MINKLQKREYTNKRGMIKKDNLHKFLMKPIVIGSGSFGLGIGLAFGGIALYNQANPKQSETINDERPTYEKIYSGINIPDKLIDKGGIDFDNPAIIFPTYIKPDISTLNTLDKLKDEIHNANIARDHALQYNADFNRAKLDRNKEVIAAQKILDAAETAQKTSLAQLAATTKVKNDLQVQLDSALAADKVDQDEINRIQTLLRQATLDKTQAENDLASKQAELDQAKVDLATAKQKELTDLTNWYKGIIIPKEETDDLGFTFNKPNIHFPTYLIDNTIDFSNEKTLKDEITKALIAKQQAIDYNTEYINNLKHSNEYLNSPAISYWGNDEFKHLIDYDNNKDLYNKLKTLVLGTSTETTIADREFDALSGSFPLYLPKVTSIGDGAFRDSMPVSITLPEVTSIGAGAFRESKLTFLSLPKVTSIGDDAFFRFELTYLSLPKVTSIGDNAFGSSVLTSLSLPEVTSIEDDAFRDSVLTSLSLPKVTSIGDDAFMVSKLTSLSLPEVTSIEDDAFEESKLTSLSLPKVTSIGDNAFMASKLTSLSLPEVTSIGDNAFGSSVLTSLSLPKVTSIGKFALGINFTVPTNVDAANPGFFAFPGNNDATKAEYDAWKATQPTDDPITDPLEYIDQFNLNIESTDEAKKIY